MELSAEILSPAFLWGGFVVYTGGLLVTFRRMPWYWLARNGVANRFVIACFATFAIWLLRAQLDGGPSVHLLGITLLTLAFGWRLAVLAISLVLVAATAINGGSWMALGANGVVLGLIGVAISYAVARLTERYLPDHFFVYVFIAAFFGAAITIGVVSMTAIAAIHASAIMHGPEVMRNYLPTAILLVFPEAFLTGAFVTLAAIYRPEWLVSYNEQRYLGLDKTDRS